MRLFLPLKIPVPVLLSIFILTLPPLSFPGQTITPSAGWHEISFPGIDRATRYTLSQDDGFAAFHAQSDSSASGLYYPVKVDPAESPLLVWKWKVTELYEKADPLKKSGDDFPARLFVTFREESNARSFLGTLGSAFRQILPRSFFPDRAIVYVWASHIPKEAHFASPYTDRCQVIVVESGPQKLNRWVTNRRNILRDYNAAFGGIAPTISGIAVMADTDHTGETASTYFGELSFSSE